MINQKKLPCPTCLSESSFLAEWPYSGLNESVFNYMVNYYFCSNCGFVFSSNISDEQLAKFYALECDYSSKDHFNVTSVANQKKYAEYYDFINECNLSCDNLVDVGCGRGGFLYWLKENNLSNNCSGVEFDVRNIELQWSESKDNTTIPKIEEGTTKSLKFENESQELLTYFHVWEHIRELNTVIKEAFRVLKFDGGIIIEVPDAENYEKHPIGTSFWFSIREHVNHFTLKSLTLLLENNGFSIQKVQRKILPASDLSYPSLLIYAKKEQTNCNLTSNINYVNIGDYLLRCQEELLKIVESVYNLKDKYQSITFWGLSSQMFSLLPLINCDYTLCDADPQKQNSVYHNQRILSPNIVSPQGGLVVASSLHTDKIINSAYSLGWTSEQILVII
jgi:ubiquinone/menaquinone biosynthesis C-methylase UbiE